MARHQQAGVQVSTSSLSRPIDQPRASLPCLSSFCASEEHRWASSRGRAGLSKSGRMGKEGFGLTVLSVVQRTSRDQQGRTVILRGVNLSAKTPLNSRTSLKSALSAQIAVVE